ncbi:MAG: dihydroorotate dehydrogenase electron transfer subunit, partial [Lachnospiraceae bacterium]|nr:dihydroorotate dehydrogenase electron transfer subunit [Lachnospiraceae bacterium]
MTEQALVIGQEEISEGIFSLWLLSKQIALQSKSGQFVCAYSKDHSRLLPRPISICEADRDGGKLRLVYRVAGEGTKEFSALKKGDTLRLLGPLGNGYPSGETLMEKQPFVLVGGGIGIPPLLQLAKDLPGEKIMVLGYRDKLFLQEDFAPLGTVVIATEDG